MLHQGWRVPNYLKLSTMLTLEQLTLLILKDWKGKTTSEEKAQLQE
jgi:hypothetical protein